MVTYRLPFAATCLLATGFTAMWLAGLFTYTTVGIDSEKVDGDRVLEANYRLRWPGDGALWIGAVAYYRPLADKPADVIDLGGRLFDRPTRVPPRSIANRVGFWLVTDPSDDPFAEVRYPKPVWTGWVAIPAWLPALAFGVWPLWRAWRTRTMAKASG